MKLTFSFTFSTQQNAVRTEVIVNKVITKFHFSIYNFYREYIKCLITLKRMIEKSIKILDMIRSLTNNWKDKKHTQHNYAVINSNFT